MASDRSLLYVETSALLAALLEHEPLAWRQLAGAGTKASSTLTLAEAERAIVRAQVAGRLSPPQVVGARKGLSEWQETCAWVKIRPALLARVGRPFPVEPVRTLDAIHLATIEALAEPGAPVVVLTRDARIRANAIALGFHLAEEA